MELTRRNFVAGAAALGGSAALASAALTAAEALADETAALPEGTTAEDFANSLVPVEPIADFVDEKSYDVVVVGAGTAGVPAVWGALEEGATVACLQKEVAPMANGNGSSGLILEESNEIGKLQYKQNWRKAGGYRMNPDLLDLWVEHSGETAMWMIGKGHELGLPPASSKATRNEYDEGSFATVVMNSFSPKPINHTDIMVKLADAAAAAGAEFFYETPGVQLVQDETGAVTGVVAQTADGYVKFNAAKAVIVAAGDYQNNESLVHRYSPDVERFARKQFNRTADGILMCMLAGARMVPVNHAKTMHDMDAAPMFMTGYPFMALNERGERFMNEEIPMESWDLSLQWNKDAEDPGRFFRIFDNAYQDKYGARTTPEQLEEYIPGFKENPVGVYPGLIDTHRADTLAPRRSPRPWSSGTSTAPTVPTWALAWRPRSSSPSTRLPTGASASGFAAAPSTRAWRSTAAAACSTPPVSRSAACTRWARARATSAAASSGTSPRAACAAVRT